MGVTTKTMLFKSLSWRVQDKQEKKITGLCQDSQDLLRINSLKHQWVTCTQKKRVVQSEIPKTDSKYEDSHRSHSRGAIRKYETSDHNSKERCKTEAKTSNEYSVISVWLEFIMQRGRKTSVKQSPESGQLSHILVEKDSGGYHLFILTHQDKHS
jgi:hypothetical protein